jgi:hypothetical protein
MEISCSVAVLPGMISTFLYHCLCLGSPKADPETKASENGLFGNVFQFSEMMVSITGYYGLNVFSPQSSYTEA